MRSHCNRKEHDDTAAGLDKEKKENKTSHRMNRSTVSVKQNNTINSSPRLWPLYGVGEIESRYRKRQIFAITSITAQ